MKQNCLLGAAALIALAAPALAETKCQVGQIAQLPVTMVGMEPQVRAKINGKDAVFTADSGAWYSMISPGNAAEFGLKLHALPPGFYVVGVGGSFTPEVTTVDTFTIAGVPVPRVQFIVGGSEVGSVGLLGQNVLALADTEFDLANGMIRLMRSKDCGKANLAYWLPPGGAYSLLETEQMSDKRPHIIAPIYINGIRLRAMFDTGANTSFVSLKAAARVGLKPGAAGVTPAGASSGLGRRFVATWIGPVASIKIGDEEIRNTHLRFGGDMEDVDMLLGADFFLSHHVYWSNTIHRLFFTFNGGHVFDLRHLREADDEDKKGEGTAKSLDATPPAAVAATASAPETAPTDAEGYSRRGAARASRGDTAGASADFDAAIKMAPDNIEYLRQRAVLRERMHQPLRAVEDLERLLKHKPDDVAALIMRAGMRLRLDPKADVRSDLDAASAAAAKASDWHFTLAQFYGDLDDYLKEIAQYDLWIAAHPDDNRRLIALNGRCWARAMANVDLNLALKDCNGALGPDAHNAAFLDSRAMVRLRMGDYVRALADYDAAIKGYPDSAWSHYGRGIAELKLGKKAEGDADIAKAKSLDADLPEEAKKRGITP